MARAMLAVFEGPPITDETVADEDWQGYLPAVDEVLKVQREAREAKMEDVIGACQALQCPDGDIHGPVVDGPELHALNATLKRLREVETNGS